MIARNLARRPWKAVLSVLGIALAVGLMVVGRFGLDGASYMMAVQFNQVQRDDVTVLYNEPLAARATLEIARLAGVVQAESFRTVPAWLRHENHAKRIEVTGLSPAHELRQLLDKQLRPVELPPEGLLLSSKLAEILAVSPGDIVTLEVLEGARGVYQVPVAGLVEEMLGLGAYMDARALGRLLRETTTLRGRTFACRATTLNACMRNSSRMPAVGGVAVRSAMQASL